MSGRGLIIRGRELDIRSAMLEVICSQYHDIDFMYPVDSFYDWFHTEWYEDIRHEMLKLIRESSISITGTDAASGATPVSFTNPDGSKQEVEAAETPADDEIVTRTYTFENAMDKDIKELYVYKSDKGNLAENGLKPGEQVSTEVFGYYLHTPNETLYTVDYTAGGQNYKFETLHIEDLFDKILLTGTDAASGATPIGFEAKQ